MDFVETTLADAFLVESAPHKDVRGYFARLRCSREFFEHGLPERFVQTNLSFNETAGTFRGLHYQLPPSREGKLLRCLAGAIEDVIVDLRPDSETFLRHEWFRLTDRELKALFVPAGFAHGFLTAAHKTVVMYEMTDYYAPDLGRGIRWSDPALSIRLPRDVSVIDPRDSTYADLDPQSLECFRSSGS